MSNENETRTETSATDETPDGVIPLLAQILETLQSIDINLSILKQDVDSIDSNVSSINSDVSTIENNM